MSAYLSSFYALQYPATKPAHPDSFPDSRYYHVGILDICMIISMIAVMAILRDALRLGFFEPLARWKLYRDLRRKREKVLATNGNAKPGNGHAKLVNGNANGHTNGHMSSNPTKKQIRLIERSVIRFAEQGWSVFYYPLQWAFGVVRFHFQTLLSTFLKCCPSFFRTSTCM